jgi:hypothetical protein
VSGTATQTGLRRWWALRQSPASIYGTVIGGSVMAAVEDNTEVDEVAATVLVTVLVYWAAERWSNVLGTHLQDEPLDRRRVMQVYAEGWPMVQAPIGPVAVMLVAYWFGASANQSVGYALIATLIVLVALGVGAGRRAGLSRWGVVRSAAFTGFLGAVLILLKAAFH